MFSFFKKKRNQITINCNTDSILVNDIELNFPTSRKELITLFGKPSRELEKSKTYLIWDEDGILCGYNDSEEILSINIYQNNKDTSEYNTTNQFIGSLFFDGNNLTNNEFEKIPMGKFAIHRLGSESDIRFGFTLGLNNHR